MVNTMYSTQELQEIQLMIERKRSLTREQFDILIREFGDKEIHTSLHPFVELYVTNPDLYRKITEDERVETYSLFGFFPETFDLVYGSEVSPGVAYVGNDRDNVVVIQHPTKKVVIYPTQNSREYEIAQIASDLGVGPKQYQTLDGFLTEEFVEGDFFPMLKEDRTSSEDMYQIGRRAGEILLKLHGRDIFYNDIILSDDFRRSHLIVPEASPAVLIDYAVAIKLDRHPNLSDEEVFNFSRTLPGVNMFLGMQPSQEQVQALVQEYRPEILITKKEEIMARDVDVVNEGLTFASFRLGNHIVEPFARGFRETYSR